LANFAGATHIADEVERGVRFVVRRMAADLALVPLADLATLGQSIPTMKKTPHGSRPE